MAVGAETSTQVSLHFNSPNSCSSLLTVTFDNIYVMVLGMPFLSVFYPHSFVSGAIRTGSSCLHMLPKLPLGWALLHHKQQAGHVHVNNVRPWNAIMHLGYHGTSLGLYCS